MTALLGVAWLLQKTLGVAGLIGALAGVAIFGWYFIRINAVAARGEGEAIPAESWRGKGARRGLSVFASGVFMAIAAMALAGLLPVRY